MNVQLYFQHPSARTDDPDASRAAARSVHPANRELIERIRAVVANASYALSHEQIAHDVLMIHPGRWTAGTVVSACARADLVAVGTTTNERGRTVTTWATA